MISPFLFALWVTGMGLLGCAGVILGTVGLIWVVLEVINYIEEHRKEKKNDGF